MNKRSEENVSKLLEAREIFFRDMSVDWTEVPELAAVLRQGNLWVPELGLHLERYGLNGEDEFDNYKAIFALDALDRIDTPSATDILFEFQSSLLKHLTTQKYYWEQVHYHLLAFVLAGKNDHRYEPIAHAIMRNAFDPCWKIGNGPINHLYHEDPWFPIMGALADLNLNLAVSDAIWIACSLTPGAQGYMYYGEKEKWGSIRNFLIEKCLKTRSAEIADEGLGKLAILADTGHTSTSWGYGGITGGEWDEEPVKMTRTCSVDFSEVRNLAQEEIKRRIDSPTST